VKRILVVDDEPQFRDLYTRALAAAGFEAEGAGSAEEALEAIRREPPDMVISDVRMPGADGIELLRKTREFAPHLPFLLVTAYADVRDAVTALKLGAVDYLEKPVDLDELTAAAGDILGVAAGGEAEGERVPPEALRGIVAASGAMKAVFRDAYRVAQSDVPVLVTGESGTGKEVVARFIHAQSGRRGKPFVAVNCAAVQDTLFGSALFGHVKGAFTGALADRKGYFREADTGTLFLDEIADMPLDIQPAILRALETHTITPVGSDREVKIDFRLIAATNRDLEREMEEGRFRADLFYRVNVIAVHIPPLRQRREDILPLARLFLSRSVPPRRLSRAAADLLLRYGWPGNVRELENAMQRAVLMCGGDVILPEHLPAAVREKSGEKEREKTAEIHTLEEMERETIRKVLAQTGGNRTLAAELLGISRRGLIYKMKRLGLG